MRDYEAYFDYGQVDETTYRVGESLLGTHYSVGDPDEEHVVVLCDYFDLDDASHRGCDWKRDWSHCTIHVENRSLTRVVFGTEGYRFYDDFNGVVVTRAWLGGYLRVDADGRVLPRVPSH